MKIKEIFYHGSSDSNQLEAGINEKVEVLKRLGENVKIIGVKAKPEGEFSYSYHGFIASLERSDPSISNSTPCIAIKYMGNAESIVSVVNSFIKANYKNIEVTKVDIDWLGRLIGNRWVANIYYEKDLQIR